MGMLDNLYQPDGTVTYWSVYEQVWVDHAESVPDQDLAAMSDAEREHVVAHLDAAARSAWL